MKTEYEKLINHFGIKKQIAKAREEMAELIVMLYHWEDKKVSEKKVISEIADVQIMIDQLTTIFGMEGVVDEMERKMKRTFKRIKNGYYKK